MTDKKTVKKKSKTLAASTKKTIKKPAKVSNKVLAEKADKKAAVKAAIFKWLRFVIVAVVLCTAIYLVLNYVPYFASREQFVVVSGSMSPTIEIGDLVTVNKNYDLNDLEIGDVIAFYMNIDEDEKQEVVIHYIASIVLSGDLYEIKTRRENVTDEVDWDSWTLTGTDVIGTYDFHIPKIGKLVLFAQSLFGKIIIIVDVIVVCFIFESIKKNIFKPKILKSQGNAT